MTFRIGGIQECMAVSVFLSMFYLVLAFQFDLPLVENDVSTVFATFFLLFPSFFICISLIEIFIFERNLNWDGKEIECVKVQEAVK